METTTTGKQVMIDLNAELLRIVGDESICVEETVDYTVLKIVDTQETSCVSVDVAIAWLQMLRDVPANHDAEDLDAVYQPLLTIKNWQCEDPDGV